MLLAGPTASTVVADTSGADWEADRQALLDHSLSLAGSPRPPGLVLRSDLLRPWARWITPVVEARRYDTRFFAAAIPAGQRTRHVGGEADEVAWWQPDAAIRAARRRETALMPPTAVCLAELGACGQVDCGAAGRPRPAPGDARSRRGRTTACWLTATSGPWSTRCERGRTAQPAQAGESSTAPPRPIDGSGTAAGPLRAGPEPRAR